MITRNLNLMRALLLGFSCFVLTACCAPATESAATTAFTAEVVGLSENGLQVRLGDSSTLSLNYVSTDLSVGDKVYIIGTLAGDRVTVHDLRRL